MRILFVEDDSMIGEAVFENLKEASYAVDWVRDGEAALSSIDVCPYDMVLLDLGLPKVDGMDVLKKIRSLKNNMPVLLITARDAVEDRIRGLDSGADDYILKPFAMGELLARIRAASRRQSGLSAPLLTGGGITLDPATHKVKSAGTECLLSAKEFALLRCLMQNKNLVMSREQLLVKCWGYDYEGESRAVDTHIKRLREKLGDYAECIKTVIKAGYRLEG